MQESRNGREGVLCRSLNQGAKCRVVASVRSGAAGGGMASLFPKRSERNEYYHEE